MLSNYVTMKTKSWRYSISCYFDYDHLLLVEANILDQGNCYAIDSEFASTRMLSSGMGLSYHMRELPCTVLMFT